MRVCRIGTPAPARPERPKSVHRSADAETKGKLGQRNTSIVAYFPTWKGPPRIERLRHYAHRAVAALLETEPTVLSWTTEAAPITVPDGDGERVFVPNFWVVERGRTVALRVLRQEHFDRPRREERHRVVREAYREMGVHFEARTEEDIAADPRLPAAKEMLRHRQFYVPDEVAVAVGAMAEAPPRTLGQLQARLGAAVTWQQMLAMVGRGCIEVGATAGLGPETEVLACRMAGKRS